MNSYRLTKSARKDIDEIWDYIAKDNPDAADRMVEHLREAFHQLALYPAIGHTRSDLRIRDARFWPVGAYLIIYRVVQNTVEISAVTEGSRDVPTLLRKRSSSAS